MSIATALSFLLIFSAGSIIYRESENLHALVRENVYTVKKLFTSQVSNDAKLLGTIIDLLIEEEEGLREAWLLKDRAALLNQALPLFKAMGSQHNVTHFYFIDLQGVCFLRVHQPFNFGDTIDRSTLKQAMSSGSSTYGVELGPLGILTLRRVYPWYINNKLEGYIELGEEIYHIAPEIKRILEVELIFTIDKSFVDREQWEEGLKVIGKTGNWEYFRDFVTIGNTIEGGMIPKKIDTYLKRFHEEHSESIFKVSIEDRIYCGGFAQLIDAGGRDIGDLVVLKDVTKYQRSLIRLFAALAVAYVITGGVFFVYLIRSMKASDR